MALLDLDQKEAIPQKLLLNSLPAVNASVLSVVEQTIQPKIPIDNKLRSFEFEVMNSADYIDCSNIKMRLEITIKKTDADGKLVDIAASDKVSLINMPFCGLFTECEVYLNNKLCSISNHCYGYKSYIRTLLKYDKQVCTMKLSNLINFQYDTPKYHEDFTETDGVYLNQGFEKRRQPLLMNKKIVMESKLENIDIFSFSKYLLSGVKLNLKFFRATDDFVLLVDPKDKSKFVLQIIKSELKIPFIKLSSGLLLAHAEILGQTSLKMPIQRTEMRIVTIPQGSSVYTNDNIYSILPDKVVVTFVSTAGYIGQLDKNAFKLDHYGVRSISIRAGTDLVSPSPIEMDFKKNSFMDAYLTLYNQSNSLNDNFICSISPEDYINGYFMVCFDLDNYVTTQLGGGLINRKNMELRIEFSENLSQSICCLVYSESTRLIEITENRTVKYHDF